MKVVNLSKSDYSNFSYMNGAALRSVGVDCTAYTLQKNDFNYPKMATVIAESDIKKLCDDADVIQIFHTSRHILNFVRNLGKKIFVYHTGTLYRQNPLVKNDNFNTWVDRCFIDSPEFYTLGAKNVTYIAPALDMDMYPFSYSGNKVFAHYPHKTDVKGTDKIIEMMKSHDVDFRWSADLVPFTENIKRMSDCDVYVELFSPLQQGKPYGSFGTTAIEASALGKRVITNSLFHHVYTEAYGSDELFVANTENEFHAAVERAKEYTKADAERIRQWVEDKHSLKATGQYLLKFL